MFEVHLTFPGRRTACGLDARGQRATRQVDLVTCRDCKMALVVAVVDRARELDRWAERESARLLGRGGPESP